MLKLNGQAINNLVNNKIICHGTTHFLHSNQNNLQNIVSDISGIFILIIEKAVQKISNSGL